MKYIFAIIAFFILVSPVAHSDELIDEIQTSIALLFNSNGDARVDGARRLSTVFTNNGVEVTAEMQSLLRESVPLLLKSLKTNGGTVRYYLIEVMASRGWLFIDTLSPSEYQQVKAIIVSPFIGQVVWVGVLVVVLVVKKDTGGVKYHNVWRRYAVVFWELLLRGCGLQVFQQRCLRLSVPLLYLPTGYGFRV